jgi:drug/metabolite transporter (DMT)-like permease
MGSVLVKRQKHGMDVYAFIVWHSLAGAAVLHVLALGLEGGGRAAWDLPGTLSLFYLAVISSGLGFIAYFTLLERIGPIRSNIVSYLAPVAATVAAFAVLGQPFEARAAVAYAFVAAGFWLIARPARGARSQRELPAEAAAADADEAP